ncbi:MAG: cytochrome c oxidase subunit 3 [Betaproteobacteria bacterium]|nr:cytochrome c oxidase subunit 3 [Betaproteobacteria bacterium]
MTAVGSAAPSMDRVDDDENGKSAFGFWVFLMSDAALFAVLFATYAVMMRGTGSGPGPAEAIGLKYAFPETLVLLTSTLTMGFAAMALHADARRSLVVWLGATLVLGAVFLALEAAEFHGMAAKGDTPQVSGFLSGFFALVGAHGLHVTAGMVWGLAMLVQGATSDLSAPVRSRLGRFALYWHFLDLIWVGIFSIVYLRGTLG